MLSTSNKLKNSNNENLVRRVTKKAKMAIKIPKDRNNHNKKMMEVKNLSTMRKYKYNRSVGRRVARNKEIKFLIMTMKVDRKIMLLIMRKRVMSFRNHKKV